jgi:hypothetical protein
MRPTDFLRRFAGELRAALPPERRAFETRFMGSLVKVFYGNSKVHFELWLRSNGYMEIGLHFEADQDSNARWLRYFSERALDVIGELGPQVEIEQWTKTWGRIHQTIAFSSPNEKLLAIAVERMSAMIRVLQPMLEEA